MRSATIAFLAAAVPACLALVSTTNACSDDSGTTPDASHDGTTTDAPPDTGSETSSSSSGGGPDGSMVNCKLSDMTDPVALCIQKLVLAQDPGGVPSGVLAGAYVKGKGVATSWDSMTGAPDTDDAGAMLHSWQDDLAFASSIASYHCSSGVYGDTSATPLLDQAIMDLAPLIEQELATLPDSYDGETYLRLRNAEAGLYYVDAMPDGDKLKALADAYGKQLQTKYALPVTSADGGATATVLGRAAGGGAVAYAPADVVSGAAALLHMAVLHASDDPTDAATWVSTAQSAIAYVWSRARDPQTGLFYGSLVTSADPQHDMVADDGTLLTDVQGLIVLSLARADDLTQAYLAALDGGADGGPAPGYYLGLGNQLVDAMQAAGLYDGPMDRDSGAPGTYMQGVRGGTIVLTDRPVIGNAFLFGGLHRVATGIGADQGWQAKQVRAALLQQVPNNSSLLSVVTNPGQDAYLRAAARDWKFAIAFLPDGGDAGEEPRARSYRTDAVAAMVEGLTQLWHGSTHPETVCAP